MTAKKVLVIDDNEVFRRVMAEALEEKGIQVHTVKDGIEGLEKMSSEDFDLVLLDLLLPRMTGFDVLKEIRKNQKTAAIPVLAVSGVFKKEEHIAALRETGANGFVSKDLNPLQIADRVLRAMSRPAAPSPAAADRPAPDRPAAKIEPGPALARMFIFKNLNQKEREEILGISRKVKFSPGDTIIKEGEEGDKFYGILAGVVRVEKRDVAGKPTVLARLQPGTGFGELALVDREKRSATCIAETEVELLEISRSDFENALAGDPGLERKCLRALLLLLARRLREVDTSLTYSRTLLEEMTEKS